MNHGQDKKHNRMGAVVDILKKSQPLNNEKTKTAIQLTANQLYLEACEVYNTYLDKDENIELYKNAKKLFKAAMIFKASGCLL